MIFWSCGRGGIMRSWCIVDGCFLPKQENQFVHKALEELDAFHQRGDPKSLILFPPLPSRLRFLIHKMAERFPELSTFSVGVAWDRRVCVCFSELRLVTEESSSDTDVGSSDRTMRTMTSCPSHSKATRHPDKAIYVPRALRKASKDTSSTSSSSSTSLLSLSISESSDATEQEPSAPTAMGTEPQITSHFMAMTLEDSDTENLTTLNQEELDNIYQEIAAHLKEAAVIQHAQNDYTSFQNVQIDHADFAHVIEIYDFPAIFKSKDLIDAFADYSDGGLRIEWVDDTHALGIFSSASAALHSLSITHPLLKTRILSKGSTKSKGKAVRRAEFLQPVKERPPTDPAVARRMVSRALGLETKRN